MSQAMIVIETLKPSTEKKTSYQGTRRTYGFFKCQQCNRSWSSGNSWANSGQQCKSCNKLIYPHHQRPLTKRSNNKGPKKPHLSNLCEKCNLLGLSCTNYEKSATNNGTSGKKKRNRRRRRAKKNSGEPQLLNMMQNLSISN